MRELLLSASILALSSVPGRTGSLLERLHGKLAASFAANPSVNQGGDILLLAMPGIPLDREACRDDYWISQLADQIPRVGRLHQPSGFSYSKIYEAILEQAETSNFQNQAARQKALDARRLIQDRAHPGKPSAKYAAYLKYQSLHVSALDDLNLARAEQLSTGKPVPPGLELEVAAAESRWRALGYKDEIERAATERMAFINENVKYIFNRLLGEFQTVKRVDGHPTAWYPIDAEPPPETWHSDQGWKDFQISHADLEPIVQGGPRSARQPSSPALIAQLKRVNLERPWMDPAVFSSRGWRFTPQVGYRLVSSGHPGDPEPGVMPLLVKGVLLSRNLILDGSGEDAEALGARRDSAQSASAKGVQIIGFFCATVPRCPDPDEKAFRGPTR